ncbi:MAG TPA: hypothetical protein VFG09_06205 [Thermodesulfovibrionales bacterium]|nr:hypothetical protein [Thermodesulfovibrionales bacterium]
MKKYFFLLITLCIAFAFFLMNGCGSGSGSPGSSGSEDTGVTLDATITPTYNGANTNSVDAFQDICDPGPPVVVEFFADHSATVAINATLINPNPPIPAGVLTIQKYTIDYRASKDSIGAPPIQSDTRFVTVTINPPFGGLAPITTTFTAEFLDLTRKDQYAKDVNVTSGIYTSRILNNYTATYTFQGENSFGQSFTIQAQADFQIGNFNNCK